MASLSNSKLKTFVERIERIDEEIKASNKDKSELYGEAKAAGYDVKILRKVIAERRIDPKKRAEMDDIAERYRAELGMK